MIQCPECGKEIADNSVHCGYCGAEIETGGGKKTMIGFAAVTQDSMQEAAEQARKARQAAEQEANQQAESQSGGGGERKLKLPKPGVGSPGSSSKSPGETGGSKGAPKFSIPKPGNGDEGGPAASPEAKTEMMGAVSGRDSRPDDTVPEGSPPAMDTAGDTEPTDFGAGTAGPSSGAPDDTGSSGFGTPADREPSTPPNQLGGTPDATDVPPASGPAAAAGPGPAPPTIDEDAAVPSADTSWESGTQETFGDEEWDQGPSEFGGAAQAPGGDMVAAQNTLPEKDNKKPIIIAAVIAAGLLLMCCVIGAILSFI